MMNRMFVSILILSIAGGFVSVIFKVCEQWFYELTSAKFMVWLNIVVLFTFVIPFYKVLSWQDGSAYRFAYKQLLILVKEGTPKAVFFNSIIFLKMVPILTTVWTIGVILYLIIQFILYYRFIQIVEQNHFLIFHEQWLKIWDKLYKEETYNKKVKLVASSLFDEPCTTGICQKYVIIPAKLLNYISSENIEFLLSHELMHIKRKDVILKLFLLILNSLNWFNPLFYLLKRSLHEWTEMGCDEELLRTFSKEQKKNYVKLLYWLTMGEYSKIVNSKKPKEQFIAYFIHEDAKKFKRRANGIMRKNGKKLSFARGAITSGCMMLAIMGGSVIAKAADVPIHKVFSVNTEVVEASNISMIDGIDDEQNDYNEFYIFDTTILDKKIREGLSPITIENDRNVTYTVIMQDETLLELKKSEIQTKHNHVFVPITLKEHEKYKNGSCKTSIYNAEKCTVCEEVWIGDVIDTIRHDVCRH